MKIFYQVIGHYGNQEDQTLGGTISLKSGLAESIPVTQEVTALGKLGNLEGYEVKIIATSLEE